MLKKLWNIVSVMLICVLIAIAIMTVGVRLFGIQPFTVLSGSMAPAYPTGALIYVKPTDAQQVHVGDPITFHLGNGQTVATHRVISIDEENACFYTKGDANETPDGQPVSYDHLIGVPVFSVPLLGYVSSFISAPPGLYVAIAVVLAAAVLLFLPGLLRKAQEQDDAEENRHALRLSGRKR